MTMAEDGKNPGKEGARKRGAAAETTMSAGPGDAAERAAAAETVVDAVPPAREAPAAAPEPQFLHPDGSAAVSGSQRIRLIPPDGKPSSWFLRNRERIVLAEYALTGVFFLLALYFLALWLTAERKVAYAPDRGGFRAALAALPPAAERSGWRVPARPGRWRMIVVHHTAAPRGSVASIDRYHREENKWPNGLGYHFLIGNGDGMADGEVAPGPRWEKQQDGAHVRMKGTDRGNSFSIGVALVGNFEERVPSARQLSALRGLLRFLADEYGIPPGAIVGHGQVSERHTACPGKLFFMDEVVNSLRT